jgi:hypothetical protein
MNTSANNNAEGSKEDAYYRENSLLPPSWYSITLPGIWQVQEEEDSQQGHPTMLACNFIKGLNLNPAPDENVVAGIQSNMVGSMKSLQSYAESKVCVICRSLHVFT